MKAKMEVLHGMGNVIVFGFIGKTTDEQCWASFSLGELSSEQVEMVAERFKSAVRTINRMVSVEVTSLEP